MTSNDSGINGKEVAGAVNAGAAQAQVLCGACGMERALNSGGVCAMCAERAVKAMQERSDANAAEALAAANGGSMSPAGRPADEAPAADGPSLVGEMHVRLMSDGACSIDGPLHNRKLVLAMLNAAHDCSYEYSRREEEARERAARPVLKKWSKAWWADQFRQRAERKAAEEAEARAAKTQGQGGTPG